MSNSLLSGFTDEDAEEEEILEMSSGSTPFPINPLYQSTSFTSTTTVLPTTSQTPILPQQTSPSTMPQFSTSLNPTISFSTISTIPFTTPLTTTPLASPITTRPFVQQATTLQPQTTSLQAQTTLLQSRSIQPQTIPLQTTTLQTTPLHTSLPPTTQQQTISLQTMPLHQTIPLQTTPLQTTLQPQQTTPLQPQQTPQQQTTQQPKPTALTLTQLQQAQQQIIYRLQQLKQLIQQAQLQKQTATTDASSTTPTPTTPTTPTTPGTTTPSSTTPSTPASQTGSAPSQTPTAGSQPSQTPNTPTSLVSGAGGKPSVPLHTMLPQLLQQQQALVQKYHQTQQQIQLLSGGQNKQAPAPQSTNVQTTTPSSPLMTTQKQISLVWQKLQEVQQQLQIATKLAGASPSPSTPPSPTVVNLQKQQQILIKQYQQLIQLQSKTPPPPGTPASATPTHLAHTPTTPPLAHTPTTPPLTLAPTSPTSLTPTPLSSLSSLTSLPPANTSPLALLQMNAALQTSLAPSLGSSRIENSGSHSQNALSSSTSLSSTSLSSSSSASTSSSADVAWSLHEQAKLQKAIVKFGTNFSVLSTALGTKSSTQVRKFYHQSGGAKGSYRFYLAEHHRLKKNEGVLDGYTLDLTPEEEELLKQGKLPEMNLLSSSQTFTPPPTAGDMTPPDIFDAPPPDKDPLEGMDDVQKKEYKRKRAEQIFAANDRGIFQTNEEGESEVNSPKKSRRPPKVGTIAGGGHSATLPSSRNNSSKSLAFKKIEPGTEK